VPGEGAAQFDHLFAVNVRGAFLTIQGAVRRMRSGGRIINISSVASRHAAFAHGAALQHDQGGSGCIYVPLMRLASEPSRSVSRAPAIAFLNQERAQQMQYIMQAGLDFIASSLSDLSPAWNNLQRACDGDFSGNIRQSPKHNH